MSEQITLQEAARDLLDAMRDGQQHVGYRMDLWNALRGCLDTPTPPPTEVAEDGEGVRVAELEVLGAADEWLDKRKELEGWTGSAWLAGEEPGMDGQRRAEIYGFLCGLIGWLQSGEDAIRALAAPTKGDGHE